ncbi:MAG: aminoacyl-tRNA deacylase [Desulfobacterales bacterium]|nr:aminoacyl-tRNA deacylase [Desulfobacterales bacterium]
MKTPSLPVTLAVRFLRRHRIDFIPHFYPYQNRGGAMQAAEALGLPPESVVKTLVFDASGETVLVLMHGDREISTRQLARAMGVKRVAPCDVAAAERKTGYRVGGISPFGTREALAVWSESSIFKLERIFINGGKRGFLVEIQPKVLMDVLGAHPVEAAAAGPKQESCT